MVVIRLNDGSTREYHVRRSDDGLRLVGAHTSHDLRTMLEEGGWRIVGVNSEAAKRLLATAGLLTPDVAVLRRPFGRSRYLLSD